MYLFGQGQAAETPEELRALREQKMAQQGEREPTFEELQAAFDGLGPMPSEPTGMPGNMGEGLTFLGASIAYGMEARRRREMEEQMRAADPQLQIARALMNRGQG